MEEIVYDVFARKSRGDTLQHVGYIDALDDELARVHAWQTYDERRWFEMCIVRRANIIPVNLHEDPFAGGRRAAGAEEARQIPAGQPYGGES